MKTDNFPKMVLGRVKNLRSSRVINQICLKVEADIYLASKASCYSSSIVKFSETSRMDERGATRMFSRIDERATRMFSRMDESATLMCEWIEERMWLIEPGNYRHWDEWPWNLVLFGTGVLLVLLIFLIGVLKSRGLDPPPLS